MVLLLQFFVNMTIRKESPPDPKIEGLIGPSQELPREG